MFTCYDDFKNFFSLRLANLRGQKAVSARDMSLSLGMTDAYINHIENKSNMPSMENFFYICEYLKVTPKDFFDTDAKAPEMLTALINECKQLDRDSLQGLLTFVKNAKR